MNAFELKSGKKISFKIGDILKGKGGRKDLSHLRRAGSSINMLAMTLIFSLREKAQGELVLAAPCTSLTTSNIGLSVTLLLLITTCVPRQQAFQKRRYYIYKLSGSLTN